MSDQVPSQKRPKLIVVVAFDRGNDGELFPAFGPADQQSEERAIRIAKDLAGKHVGVPTFETTSWPSSSVMMVA
ncbi:MULTISPECIES: hypothetical protein [unclassified Mesorhizobium]|uniref:hypothetical protein n=1 Tax=unclassified Mesorhizobium TaxID=325217 RepID=UPI001129930E|nr:MULTISPECIES: hypothetical protein [unclassified Mesorhizobium]MBZ9739276.1 hypothetical protein [Mesorhizobium sp. CO1-1-4]MBZ9801380.1 hypothetical protein [Mesorhizobium sp. ES1-6]TPL91010.1 hypothetical protein FJ948_16155 [Mesorhizobium sp. B2-3-12]